VLRGKAQLIPPSYKTDSLLQDGNGNSVNLSKRQRNVGSVIGNLDGRGNNLGNEVAGGNGVHNEKFV